MVQETKRFLSYICPRCMQSVIVERDLFSLAAAPAHIKCPCGKSELGVEFFPNRVQLTVPCLFCGREHTVSCSSHAFRSEQHASEPHCRPSSTYAGRSFRGNRG